MAPLKFAPWSSDIELSFYAALRSLKINHDKLDDAARKVVGRYEVRPNDAPDRSARMQMHGDAFTSDEVPGGYYRAEGILRNVNTIEEYKALNTRAIIEQAGRTIWDAIRDGTIYSCPSLLASFHAIFFADLKKYRFTYHFAFPSIHSDPVWDMVNNIGDENSQLNAKESLRLFDMVQTWRYSVDARQHGFFLARRDRKPPKADGDDLQATENVNIDSTENRPSSRPQSQDMQRHEDLGFLWAVGPLASFEDGFFDSAEPDDRFVCFADPSTFPGIPSLVLRNLLVLVRQRWHQDSVQVLCYRDTHMRRDRSNSFILKLKSASGEAPTKTAESNQTPQMPRVTGWERNENGVINSRNVDLSGNMDPVQFADQSVDLNIKLMKWRIAPDLDLDVIKNTKCLLLGAGTLGSYVSRNLLGWGVRKITFVDNGSVSYSNPVRQPLFNFKDCVNGGVKKAQRAAEALREIYPGVDANGYDMSVPMAGHPIMDESKVKGDFDLLQQLVEEHDAIFLLMDTRESRWLPTVMGKAKGKIVMNAALGFDSYVVMRHGVRKQRNDDMASLGCYFCNDVVAPADSLKDRTLDQQCTVTRPGIAAIASALLVEILVSVLQHPLGAAAPAPATTESPRSPPNHPLGLIPHSIRGFLSNFTNMMIRGPDYDCCSACSEKIISAYEQDGWEFVKRVLNEKGYVEELSGLAEVQRKAEAAAGEVEWDEDDEVGDIEDEGEVPNRPLPLGPKGKGEAESGGIPEVITQGPTPPHSPPLAAQACANEPTTKRGKAHIGKGGAVHTITGECERFFCEALRAIFLGERERAQDSLGMGARTWKHRYSMGISDDDDDDDDPGPAVAFRDHIVAVGLGTPPPDIGHAGSRHAGYAVSQWLEIWDYAGGVRFRGFTAERDEDHRTLFVFFDKTVVGRDLKQGLMALIELASTPSFSCSEMVVCFDRAEDGSPSSKSLLRDLGWVGFELATLARWAGGIDLTSDRWLFLGMEV